MKNTIEIEGLNKHFGDIHAVQDLSFHVQEGELFAFLGVNGAGKSTTISILCGQLQKDSGRVTVCGREHRPRHGGGLPPAGGGIPEFRAGQRPERAG